MCIILKFLGEAGNLIFGDVNGGFLAAVLLHRDVDQLRPRVLLSRLSSNSLKPGSLLTTMGTNPMPSAGGLRMLFEVCSAACLTLSARRSPWIARSSRGGVLNLPDPPDGRNIRLRLGGALNKEMTKPGHD